MYKQKSTPWEWRDLYWFLAIDRAPNLRKAAEAVGVSAATLSRRVRSLEENLQVDIFVRDSNGYTLTPYGERLLEVVKRMDEVANEIERLSETGTTVVRVAAGSWMSQFLAKHIDLIQRAEDSFTQEWVTGSEKADITRRHVHIGIRNSRPVEGNIAGRRLVNVAFCVYRKRNSNINSSSGWVTVKNSTTPSSLWVAKQPGAVVAKVSEPTLVLPWLRAGKGCAVLPCFVGDPDPRLEREDEIIESLTHEQWLVAHQNDRDLPAVRTVLDRLAALVLKNQELFSGTRPAR